MYTFSTHYEGSKTLLVYTLRQNEAVDNFCLGMLMSNRIPGIAETTYSQMNEEKYIMYDITAKVPLRQYFNGVMSKKQILQIMTGVLDSLIASEEYMLPVSSLVLDLEYIYSDVLSNTVTVLCLPVSGVSNQITPLDFFKNLTFNTQFDQSENCDYVASIINYLNAHPVLPLEEFRQVLMSLTAKSSVPNNGPVSGMTKNPVPQQPRVQQPIPEAPQVQMPISAPVYTPPNVNANLNGHVTYPKVDVVTPEPAGMVQEPHKVQDGPKMGLMYLLKHYSKENLEIYKAQKNTDKKKTKDKKKGKSKKDAQPQPSPGFYVPGQHGGSIPTNQQGAASIPFNPQSQTPPVSIPQTMPPAARPVQQPMSSPGAGHIPSHPINEPAGLHLDFGETEVLGDPNDGQTEILGEVQNPQQQLGPYLLRVKNNERIPLTQTVFRIGRNNGANDYVVADNTHVGNSHCVILIRDGEYFLVDNHSQNKSYVDGAMVQPGVEAKLSHATRISLADEDFVFYLY